jgi:hypothetical protein
MTSSIRAARCPGTCHAASTHPNPLPKMRRQRETCPRRQTRQTSHNVTTQLTKSVSPMCPGAIPAACPRGPDEAPARRRSTYNPRMMAGLARQMASARCSVRGPSCRVITATAGFFWELDVLPKLHQHLPGHPAGPGAARGDRLGLYRRLEADGQIWQPSEWLGVPETHPHDCLRRPGTLLGGPPEDINDARLPSGPAGTPVVATTSFDAPDGPGERRGSFGAQRAIVSQEVVAWAAGRPFVRGARSSG